MDVLDNLEVLGHSAMDPLPFRCGGCCRLDRPLVVKCLWFLDRMGLGCMVPDSCRSRFLPVRQSRLLCRYRVGQPGQDTLKHRGQREAVTQVQKHLRTWTGISPAPQSAHFCPADTQSAQEGSLGSCRTICFLLR